MDNQIPQVQPAQNPVSPNPAPQTAGIQSPPSPKKSFLKSKVVLVTIILLTIFAAGASYLTLNAKPSQKACTLEAEVCPDGSSVGRTGPKCEFSPCPSKPTPTPNPTADWQATSSSLFHYSIKYPKNWYSKKSLDYLEPGFPPIEGITLSTHLNGEIKNDGQAYVKVVGNAHQGIGSCDNCPYEAVTMGGFKWTKFKFEKESNPWDEEYVPNFDSAPDFGIYVKYGEHKNLTDQILSTFKFTDQSQKTVIECGSAVGQCPVGYSCEPDPVVTGPAGDAPGICVKVSSTP